MRFGEEEGISWPIWFTYILPIAIGEDGVNGETEWIGRIFLAIRGNNRGGDSAGPGKPEKTWLQGLSDDL